jgi:hypothetical protein
MLYGGEISKNEEYSREAASVWMPLLLVLSQDMFYKATYKLIGHIYSS